MRKIRNAAVIIILCIIGAYSVMKKPAAPVLNMPPGDELRDAVKNSGIGKGATPPALNFRSGGDDELHDAVAANPVFGGNPINAGNPIQEGSGDGGVNPPPRGSGNGGVGSPTPGFGQELPPTDPPPLSPSSPQQGE